MPSKSTGRRRRTRTSQTRRPDPAARAYVNDVKTELESLFSWRGFSGAYDPVVVVHYIPPAPWTQLTVKIYAPRTTKRQLTNKRRRPLVELVLTHDEGPPLRDRMSITSEARSLLSKNEMHIASIHAGGLGYSGTAIMEKLIQFARCFDYRRIVLDDESYIEAAGSEGVCQISLGLLFLLSRGERWYARFGFELRDDVVHDEKGGPLRRSAALLKRLEKSEIASIKEVRLTEIPMKDEEQTPLHAFFRRELGPRWHAVTVGDLFEKLASAPLDYTSTCRVAEIFDVLAPLLAPLPTHMVLELPNRLKQFCWDHLKPYVPRALIGRFTRRAYEAGKP